MKKLKLFAAGAAVVLCGLMFTAPASAIQNEQNTAGSTTISCDTSKCAMKTCCAKSGKQCACSEGKKCDNNCMKMCQSQAGQTSCCKMKSSGKCCKK